MIQINFSAFGRIILPVNIKPKNSNSLIPIEFKVDTGADSTTISKYDLIDLGYDISWINQNVISVKNKLTTASGEKVNAGYVQLPLINILGYEGINWPFYIIIDNTQDFKNLLGRDLLSGFNYYFNNDDDIFSITQTKIFKPRYDFLPDQEINKMHAI